MSPFDMVAAQAHGLKRPASDQDRRIWANGE